MEMTLFEKTFCKDKPIRRIERLEENFLDAKQQKEKNLPTRVDELMNRIRPSQDLLNRPDPCETAKSAKAGRASKGLIDKLIGHPQEEEYFESNKYPVIKWKAIQIPEITDAVARLSTDFEPSARGIGRLKYKILIKLPEAPFPRMFLVTLYDQNGFKLGYFAVSSRSFRETGTPNHWEANESQNFSEKDYKQARSYSVSVP
jgi:hypothetical protein